IYAFIFGIVLCEVYRRFDHLLAPMLLHFAANVLSVILTYTNAEYASQTMYIIFMVLTFAVSFAIYWFVIRKAKTE
ncbi:MAG: CPBP family glutamic-type intramembrane protease, partial [Lachnospiraceae bacterium]|nr:CPBP family glutamic-type intramembrane protease [Lachnospiraceae bacterium]